MMSALGDETKEAGEKFQGFFKCNICGGSVKPSLPLVGSRRAAYDRYKKDSEEAGKAVFCLFKN
jgi:hypothetical protein